MAGTYAVAVKTRVFELLAAAAADEDSAAYGAQVLYADDLRDLERLALVGGPLKFVDTYRVTTGATTRPRDEEIRFSVAIRAYEPGGTVQDQDARVAEVGAVLETICADRTNLGVERVTLVRLAGGDITYWREDDGVASVGDYEVVVNVPYKR